MKNQAIHSSLTKILAVLITALVKFFVMLALILIMMPSIKSFAVVTKLTATPSPYTITAGVMKSINLKTNDKNFVGQKLLTISGYGTVLAGAGIVTYPTDSNGGRLSTVLNTNGSTTIQVYFAIDSETSSYTNFTIGLYKAASSTKINYSITDNSIDVSTVVTCAISTDVASNLIVTQDITAPSVNGDQFTTQPKVVICDKYGNLVASDTNDITVSKNDSGLWNLEGTTTIRAVNGLAVFSDLRATNDFSVQSAQLRFTSGSLTAALSSSIALLAKQFTVNFKDYNNTVLKTETVDYGSTAAEPLVPSRFGYAFTGWDKAYSNITADTIVNAQYSMIRYKLIVTNGTGSGDYNASYLATVKADTPVGRYFAGWQDETGSIISYYRNYNFIITSNKTLTATFSDTPVTAVPTVSLDDDIIKMNVNDDYGKMYFTSIIAVPLENRIIECGVAVSKTISSDLTNDNALINFKSTAQNSAGQFYSVFKVAYDNTLFVRSYIIYEDVTGKRITKYSTNIVAAEMTKQ